MPERFDYGGHPDQFGELTLPLPGVPVRGTVVVIHGGYWRAAYSLDLGRPLAADLSARGWVAANLEYRRVGSGGGWPETFDDVAAGIDALAGLPALSTAGIPQPVIALGHSAGGHLAVRAASRNRPRVPLTAVVSQSGVLDLRLADELGLSDGAVRSFLGACPAQDPGRCREADPAQQVPAAVPVIALHGAEDSTVPQEVSESYVLAASAAGGEAELRLVPGDHFDLITPGTPAWAAVLAALDSARNPAAG